MPTSFLYGLLGGALIGLAAGAFLILNGRIAGISGILGGALTPSKDDFDWRLMFLAGLIAGGVGLSMIWPDAYPAAVGSSNGRLIAAGLLVGFGTRLGSGCTSGHGVCGLPRFSPRSLVATGVFIFTGAMTVLIASRVVGG